MAASPQISAAMMPITYTQIIANKRYESKKAVANMEYMGSLALHDMKGMRETVMSLVLLSEMEAVASTAGTEQPNPDIIGTTHLPERPTRDMGPSRIAATEERYPDSSRRESRKKQGGDDRDEGKNTAYTCPDAVDEQRGQQWRRVKTGEDGGEGFSGAVHAK